MAEQSQVSGIPTIEPNTLYVGQGVCIKGDVMVPGILVVDGLIEGNVTGRAVWISESGSIKGKVVATEAEIYGTVSETIEVKQLMVVRSTGRVLGDIHYGELQLEKGAVLSGTLSCVSDEQAPVVESVLTASGRPKIVRRVEAAPRPALNGSGAGTAPAGILPPADYRAAS
jgi:cytoskeletal protein CcmA (bactofilin family)